MNPNARRIVRTEHINALWDDGKGGRFYEPLHDHNDEPLW